MILLILWLLGLLSGCTMGAAIHILWVIYKIYAESFRGAHHVRRILDETQVIVSDALAASPLQH